MMLLQLLAHQPGAAAQILKNTPVWVWAVLASLIALGLSQSRPRVAGLKRVVIMPVAMTVFALWGLASAFGPTLLLAEVLVAWLFAGAAVAAFMACGEAPGSYDRTARRFQLPGSWVPMALILAVFLTKYAVGIELALQPGLARDTTFALSLALLYGLFNGIFAGRTARLLRAVRRPVTLFA